MPKVPKTVTPLRQLRLFTSHTQKEFAKLVGIKLENYSKLERGLSTLTPKNGHRIHQLTGALGASLDHRKSKFPQSHNGKPYSSEYWQWWRQWKKHVYEQATLGLVRDLLGWVQFACDVARKEGKLTELHTALAQALGSCCVECGLASAVNLELRKVKLTLKVSRRYGELRGNKRLAAEFGFTDKKYHNGQIVTDDDIWRGMISERAYWQPWGWFPKALRDLLEPLRDDSPFRAGPGWNSFEDAMQQSKESPRQPPPT
jgi:transcriptional regulator with XRE-family HTH domain